MSWQINGSVASSKNDAAIDFCLDGIIAKREIKSHAMDISKVQIHMYLKILAVYIMITLAVR